MKKLLNIFLITIIFVIPFVTNINIVDAKILKYGDVNEDNFIDGEDVSLVHAFINNAEVPTPIQKTLADINHDGNIDNTDKDLVYQMTMNTSGKLYQKGDVNMNGIIDPIDAQMVDYYIKKYIEFNSTQKQLADAFVNDMNIINQQDVSAIKSKVATNLLTRKLEIMDPIPSNNHNPNFSTDSTDNGMFVQVKDKTKTDNGYPIFYYRGNVENNYVQLGTYKTDINNLTITNNTETNTIIAHTNDPILWRIVSINYDGSIKLVAEHNTGLNVAYNSGTTSNYINNDGTNSDVKTELERWYNTHISVDKNVDNKIIKNYYCNDITDNYLGAKNRVDNSNPIFICPEGSIVNNNKVGLLTVDELMYAGSNSNVEDNITYLDNTTSFWTMTPFEEVRTYLMRNNGSRLWSAYSYDDDYASARPVITLKPNVLVNEDGDGTKDNPYVIDLENEEEIFDVNNNTTIMNTVNEVEENIITTDVLNDTKENLKTITYETYNTSSDNGNFKYSWTINPESISNVKDINTTITIKDSVSTTDGEVYNRMKYALKNNDVRYVTLKQTGDLGLTSTIKLNVSDKYNNDSNVWVYRWDDTKRRYEEVSNSTVENGQVSFNVTKGDNYIISESNLSSIIENPPTGMIMFVVIGIIGLLLIGGITYLIYSKKNNRFLKV